MAVLKIIGIILLCAVGLLLLLLLLLLFAPFRYSIDGSFRERKLDGEFRVKWLRGVLGFLAAYHQGEPLQAFISVCGFKVYDLLKKEDSGGDGEPEEGEEDDFLYSPEIYSAEKEHPAQQSEAEISGNPDEQADAVPPAEESENTAGISEEKETDLPDPDEASQEKKTLADRIRMIPDLVMTKLSDFWAAFLQKLSDLDRAVREKIDSFCKNAKDTSQSAWTEFLDKTNKARALYELFTDEEYQPALRMVKNRLLRLLKELKPRKGHGMVRYGSGDPYGTAQMMQAAILLYPLYEDRVEVIPDFDGVGEEAELDLQGRLRLFVPAEAAVRIFFNKKLRKLYHKARVILELEESPEDRS